MQEAEPIAKLISNVGIVTAFAIVAIWLLWKYGPKIAEGHMAMIDSVRTSNSKMADATERLTESMVSVQNQGKACQNTNDALLHHCDAMEHLASGHTKEREIQRSVSSMRATLKTGR